MEKIQQALERARHQRIERGAASAAATAAARAGDRTLNVEAMHEFGLDARFCRRHRLVAALPDDARADLFRRLRAQVLQRLQVLGGNSVAIFSARDREGKTLVACNLAVALARQAIGPLFLLDLDLRRPSIHRALGIDPAVGIGDYLDGRAGLEDVLWRCSDLPALHVLPQGRPLGNCSELVASAAARELVRKLRQDVPNSMVVVDLSPLLLTDEPLVVQRYVDGCVLVVQHGRTLQDDVARTAAQIEESKYLGHVLNQVPNAEVDSGYGYGGR